MLHPRVIYFTFPKQSNPKREFYEKAENKIFEGKGHNER